MAAHKVNVVLSGIKAAGLCEVSYANDPFCSVTCFRVAKVEQHRRNCTNTAMEI